MNIESERIFIKDILDKIEKANEIFQTANECVKKKESEIRKQKEELKKLKQQRDSEADVIKNYKIILQNYFRAVYSKDLPLNEITQATQYYLENRHSHQEIPEEEDLQF